MPRPAPQDIEITAKRSLDIAQVFQCPAQTEPALHMVRVEPHRLTEQGLRLPHATSLREFLTQSTARAPGSGRALQRARSIG